MATLHKLKTWPEHFEEVYLGNKTFEARKNDRDYKTGDVLVLQEYDPDGYCYTGRELEKNVTHILHGGQFGIEEGYVIMSIQ